MAFKIAMLVAYSILYAAILSFVLLAIAVVYIFFEGLWRLITGRGFYD